MFQLIRAFYRSLNYWGKLSVWISIYLFLALLVYFSLPYERTRDHDPWTTGFPEVVIVDIKEDVHIIQLKADTEGPISDQYQPLSTAIRNRVSQRLGEFRSRYRPLTPRVSIESSPDNPVTHEVATTLAQLVIRNGLGNLAAIAEDKEPLHGQPMTFWCAPQDIHLAYAFLFAISPSIQGKLALIKDPAYPAHKMRFRLEGVPRFHPNGAVVLENSPSPN